MDSFKDVSFSVGILSRLVQWDACKCLHNGMATYSYKLTENSPERVPAVYFLNWNSGSAKEMISKHSLTHFITLEIWSELKISATKLSREVQYCYSR